MFMPLDKLGAIGPAIDAIEHVVEHILGLDGADTDDRMRAFRAITEIIDVLRGGFANHGFSQADIEKEVAALAAAITGNDATADKALADKFDHGGDK